MHGNQEIGQNVIFEQVTLASDARGEYSIPPRNLAAPWPCPGESNVPSIFAPSKSTKPKTRFGELTVKAIPFQRAARMISRGTWSFLTDRPLVVSFEVTHSCTADCLHCDKGTIKPEPAGLLRAADYGRLRAQLKPMAVQLSGGEPLLRPRLARHRARREGTKRPALPDPGDERAFVQ